MTTTTFRWPIPMPPWIDLAMRYRGLKEIPGVKTAPAISKMLTRLGAWWSDDETPWCGVFVGDMLKQTGFPIPKYYMRAKEYESYGIKQDTGVIPFGAICTKTRAGGGHVFFAVAQSRDGQIIYGLGGNQANSVNITQFLLKDITSARWPSGGAMTQVRRIQLPIATPQQMGALSLGGSEA